MTFPGACEQDETTAGTAHEHAWTTESAHATSTGVVRYVRCADCGVRRVDVQDHPEAPPAALSREFGAERAEHADRTGRGERAGS